MSLKTVLVLTSGQRPVAPAFRQLLGAASICLVALALGAALIATETRRTPKTQSVQGEPGSRSTRRALVIGINDYTSGLRAAQRAGARWSNLGGAVNDAKAIREILLRQYGFEERNILVLLDRAASRKAILDALEQHLIAPARPGDEVVFFYSGHGSLAPNPASDEPDKMDESLVPADSNRGADDIRDKELARRFNRILDRGARLTVIFDSCHSGGASRGLPSGARARFLPVAKRGVADAEPTGGRPEDRGALILSASQDFQLARETPGGAGETYGAFSRSLLTALGRALPGESAEETFLRTRVLLHTEAIFQQPTLAGSAERKRAPLFGGKTSSDEAGTLVAVQRIEADGTVLLEGGWVQGLREGAELEIRTASVHEAPPRLRITRVLGPSAAEARLIETRSAERPSRRVETGDLAKLSRWVILNEPTLNLWIPEAGPQWEQQLHWARELRELAPGAGVDWISDPVERAPTQVLRWQQGGWWLTPGGVKSRFLGPEPAPREVLRQVRMGEERPLLFVQLPAPPGLARGLALGRGTANDAVERTPDPARAQYELVGRLMGDQVDFAWIRPSVGRDDAVASQLPPRSDWCSINEEECAAVLTDNALRINKIRAWLTLEPPPGDRFPYHLSLVGEAGETRRDGPLHAEERYGLLVRAEQEALRFAGAPRYLYVFTIDSFGNSTLLFPRLNQGSVENRFPLLSSGSSWPTEIRLSAEPVFRVSKPFGIDTFFLLSTDEPIPNPWVVQFPGVRSRGPQGTTHLEELLSQTGTAKRGAQPLSVPVTWSLERLTFTTLPAAQLSKPSS